MAYDIIMYSMSSWFEWERGVTNRNRYIWNAFQKHPQVGRLLFINYLPFNLKRAVREYLYGQIYRSDAGAIFKGWDYKVNQISERCYVYTGLSDKPIAKIIEILNFENPLVWSCNPMNVQWLNLEGIKVFDAIDNWAVHPSYQAYRERLLQNYRAIDRRADVIFTVSKNLNALFPTCRRMCWIPNGVDIEHYEKQREIKVANYELGQIPKPIIGYVGVIQNRFDISLAQYLAQNNPNFSFVYIGPIWAEIKQEFFSRLGKYKNVFTLGPKSYELIPWYIHDFDAAIVPHKINDLTQSMNPMKIYEYLACGKPVISTPIAGSEAFGDLIYTAADYAQFNHCLRQAVDEPKQNAAKRLEFVKEHTWDKRVEGMFDIIKSK